MTRNVLLITMMSLLTLTLVGCGGGEESTPTPLPEEAFAQIVSVTGEVVPAKRAVLSTQAGGSVQDVLVEPGDEVKAGDPLIQLDPTDAELAVQQAEAALASARAELARLEAQPRPQDIAAAEQEVEAAEAAISRAAAERNRLTSGAIEADVAAAQAQVAQAEAARKAAQIHYDEMRAKAKDDRVDDWKKEEAALRLRAAEEALESAQVQLRQAQESIAAKKQEANASVWAASANRDVVQARLDRLQTGATDAEIAMAELDVAQAQVELDAAQVQLERCRLHAPSAGTVGAVHVQEGEQIASGTPVVTLGDLSTLRVETTDLDEIDVARVDVGQTADVTFDALPDRVFKGTITRINPMAESDGGGVNYTAIIKLDELDPAVRWGMTAFVDISVDQ